MRRSVSLIGSSLLLALSAAACSSSNSIKATQDGGATMTGSCASPPALEQDIPSCTSCTIAANASPSTCTTNRPIDACCAWVGAPAREVQRAVGLHYFSGTSTTPDFSCLKTPPAPGASKMVTLTGFVKLFSDGQDSAGVIVEVHKEGPNGTVGDIVGTAVTTMADDAADPPLMPLVNWLSKCPQDPGSGCKFRSYTYANVPTETPLVIVTKDGGGGKWSPLYDYNIYFFDSAVDAMNQVHYDPSAVATTDINTVASAAGGFTIKPADGVIAGEVHDCGDVRVSGAIVDTDVAHEGPMFYFSEDESDPLPDLSRGADGTGKVGLFGALNLAAGTPIRISAVGKINGQDVLLGTHVVQTFPNSVTALSLRGRRPNEQ